MGPATGVHATNVTEQTDARSAERRSDRVKAIGDGPIGHMHDVNGIEIVRSGPVG